MNDAPAPSPALLPAGLRDLLPPEAETEAASVEALMAAFASHGYERVKPPLLEFEEGLFAGPGAAVADQTFRVMDPDTHRMMGLRADITPQIGRIAATRLSQAPRPLRLSYAGQCVRVRAGQMASGRQVPQAGIELIGVDTAEADAETILVGAEALAALGLTRVSFDLLLPQMAPALLDWAGIAPGATRDALTRALDRKDEASVALIGAGFGGPITGILTDLLRASGPAEVALEALARVKLPPAAFALAVRLHEVAAVLRRRAPGLRLTVDPIEFRGMRYHTGLCFSIYAPALHDELGRGGRYVSGEAEPAAGLTLFADAVLRAAPPRRVLTRVFVPRGSDPAQAQALRAEGFVTVAGLADAADAGAEAARLLCTHVLRDGAAVALG
ncbi:MAG: ATP phosphoribosyltransferase regulatory subunit [Janthinobacterium lividum]